MRIFETTKVKYLKKIQKNEKNKEKLTYLTYHSKTHKVLSNYLFVKNNIN